MYLNHTVFPTLSVSVVLHFYSFSTVHIKYQKKTSEYDQEIQQSHTADQDQPWYYNAFYKTTESIPFRTQIVCAKMCVRFSTFCPQCCRTARERFCCLLFWDDTLQMESSILLMAGVHTMLVSVYAISVILWGTVTGHNYSPSCNVAV